MCKCCIQKEIQEKASLPVLFQKAHIGPISHCSCLFYFSMSVSRNLSLKNLKLKPNILKSKAGFYRFNMGHNPQCDSEVFFRSVPNSTFALLPHLQEIACSTSM